jgi:hypothetical protein
MKKKILASLVATMAVGATCAFAANPFVDVPSDSWAYKSIVELTDAGIIQGVDGEHFQGQRNITRYEAAEMTAKALAHMDKASVEQRAMINKLADEYADELNNLGVRVSNLEKRVGNVKFTGDARIRYINQGASAHWTDKTTLKDKSNETKGDNSWTYRMRLRANAQINDNTKAVIGFSTDNKSFGDSTAATAQDESNSRGTFNDDANIQWANGNFNVKVGRWDAYVLGNGYGYQYGNTFDGIQGQWNNGKVAVTAGYGKFKDVRGAWQAGDGVNAAAYVNTNDLNNVKTGYGEIEGFFNKGAVGVYYNSFNGQQQQDITGKADTVSTSIKDLWGAYVKYNFTPKFNALFDYQTVKHTDDSISDDSKVFVGKLTYGNAAFAKKGTWDIWAEYINADINSLYGLSFSWRNNNLLDNVKSWGAGFDYTLMKNAQFQFMQSFGSKAKDDSVADPKEETRAQFVFVF